MAFSSPPQVVSIAGEANLVRHVYLPNLGKSFSIWTAEISPGRLCFAYRETQPISFAGEIVFDDVLVKVPGKVKSFSALVYGDPNDVIIAWDDGRHVWSMTLNFGLGTVVSPATKEFRGTLPTLTDHGPFFRVHYTVDKDLRSRIGFDGDDMLVAAVSGYEVLENDTDPVNNYVVKYTAAYGPTPEVSRPFLPDANTVSLVDSSYSHMYLGSLNLRESEQGVDGSLGGNVVTDVAVPAGGQAFQFTNPDVVVHPGIRFLQSRPILNFDGQDVVMWSIWAQVDTGSAIDTTLILGSDSDGNVTLQVFLPWSNGNVYWDCGNTGGSYDRINKAASVAEYASALTHWVFYKKVSSGDMRIYRDGVLWHSGTSKTHPLKDAHTFSIASDWPGTIADISVFNGDVTAVDPLVLYGMGPNPDYAGTAEEPYLQYHWPANSSDRLDALTDLSGNDNDLELRSLVYRDGGVSFDGVATPSFVDLPIGSEFTFEAWIEPAMPTGQLYVVRHSLLSFGFTSEGSLFFEFMNGGSKIRYRQLGGRILDYGVLNYVALSHVFGQPSPPTFMMVNGSVVPASWASGNGQEAAVISSLPRATVELGRGGKLVSFRASSVARDQAELLSYLRGRL